MTATSETETWTLVRTDRPPIIGEIRFIRKCAAATLEQMFFKWTEVIWNGKEWIETEQ